MQNIQRHQIVEAIDAFLAEQKIKKTEPLLKKLDLAQEQGDNEAVASIQDSINKVQAKYDREHWCTQEAPKMADQLKFGTHISKGIHPDSRGDNITFDATMALPKTVVGSQDAPNLEMDANRSAAALPLANFLAITVADGVKIRDLVLADHPELDAVFAVDPEVSKNVQIAFKRALLGERDTYVLDEWNKQLLWPASPRSVEDDAYVNLIPLYPSGLTHYFGRSAAAKRFGEKNTAAREANRKKNDPKTSYLFMPDLGVVHLGGSKPQNISQLNSQILGRALLMSSLPPLFTANHQFGVSKSDSTLFSQRLARSWFCREGFNALFDVIRSPVNNVHVRDRRKRAIKSILGGVMQVAASFQGQEPGWSREYALNWDEKSWLDPLRVDLDADESGFSDRAESFSKRDENDWLNKVFHGFGRWVTGELEREFVLTDDMFGDIHSTEWRREIEACATASQRAGKSVFT